MQMLWFRATSTQRSVFRRSEWSRCGEFVVALEWGSGSGSLLRRVVGLLVSFQSHVGSFEGDDFGAGDESVEDGLGDDGVRDGSVPVLRGEL